MKRVAVLRGGPSSEYDVSMLSGQAVLQALAANGYSTRDITISKTGDWLESGRLRNPTQALTGVDVVFVAMHGTYGEDGQVQRLLEQLQLPFTGSGSWASAMAFNKISTKETMCEHGVCTPSSYRLRKHELKDPRTITRIESQLGNQLFAKPPASGSSDGARRIKPDECTYTALNELSSLYDELLLEEFIEGVEATVGVLEDFRGDQLYALPVVEIIPPTDATFFDREVKYNGSTTEIVPGDFAPDLRDQLQSIAKLVHQEMQCQQYSRSDFLIKDDQIYFLEVNTLPGLTSESLFPKAAAAVGLDFDNLVSHLVETARV